MASFLIDECVPRLVHEMLAALGHEVHLVRDLLQGGDDEAVLEFACDRGNVLLTEDRRFGIIAISRAPIPNSGVMIISMGSAKPSEKAERLRVALPAILESLPGSVTVVGTKRIRRRPLQQGGASS